MKAGSGSEKKLDKKSRIKTMKKIFLTLLEKIIKGIQVIIGRNIIDLMAEK